MRHIPPFVSIIIPCRNEEDFIGKCLDSIINNSYPRDSLEVLVVDGMSEDGTRKIAEGYTKQHPFIRVLNNPKKIIPGAMNIGIRNAQGEIIMKIDSHAAYAKDYISKCVQYLIDFNADNVGGRILALPRNNTLLGKAIVLSLSHFFGVGNSLFRIGAKKPIWADAAFSGCYRKDVFDRIGLYDEYIARSEDVSINSRLRKAGGKILLVPEIVAYYYARSKLIDFWKHNLDNGVWAILPIAYNEVVPISWRHLVPLAFVTSLLGSAILGFIAKPFLWLFLLILGSYGLASFASSSQIAYQKKDIRYLIAMPFTFGMLHIGYGLGSLWGVFKLLLVPKFWSKLFGLVWWNRKRTT